MEVTVSFSCGESVSVLEGFSPAVKSGIGIVVWACRAGWWESVVGSLRPVRAHRRPEEESFIYSGGGGQGSRVTYGDDVIHEQRCGGVVTEATLQRHMQSAVLAAGETSTRASTVF